MEERRDDLRARFDHRFDGSIKLNLLALDLEVDGTLVIGTAAGYNFFAIYLDAELPAGLPVAGGMVRFGLRPYGVSAGKSV